MNYVASPNPSKPWSGEVLTLPDSQLHFNSCTAIVPSLAHDKPCTVMASECKEQGRVRLEKKNNRGQKS